MSAGAGSPSSGLPRVLVVSHNPFSDLQSNGKTLTAFFDGWDPDRLAQLFFTMDAPAFSVCRRFYRVTDVDMLRRLLRRPSSQGPVTADAVARTDAVRADLHRGRLFRMVRWMFQRRWPSALVLRSWVWSDRWATADLDRWLDEFDPEVVLFQSSNCTFAFDVVATICDRRGIPLILETTDDYVTRTSSRDPLGGLYHRQISRAYQAAVDRSHVVIAIGQKMAREYAARFGGRYEIAMNSVDALENVDAPGSTASPVVLHYAGNLGLNRWRVLAELGHALDRLHALDGIDAQLEVWSLVEPEAGELEQLTSSARVRFCGSASSEQLADRRREATALVHVESFDRHNREITRLSISTKVPEYLASNRPVLAIGPSDVASIEYLTEHQAAEVVTTASVEDLVAALRRLLGDADQRRAYAARGAGLVREHHLRSRISAMVRTEILEAARG
ncbi:glycosyltransferase [Nocardioides sp. MAH-18]|uniref:Glycosyltransferase n=1 Tax=Nocardioides agri TaxID=2682843 RepID=A0A6L6XQZ0_9ACTN|nr:MULTISPECIES: glycosyltransferase [unclassified Nocardioides]MBA2954880.1 glycosyltransferase [Nocardioides sp. CGMCC 1.13656]MVQ49734.1 glycosyltransferase [Nocardioides sp. MAH-18]